MFCENCGNKIQDGDKFCTKCGHSVATAGAKIPINQRPVTTHDEKWWQRLLKVIYIVLYIPLPLILWAVWDGNSSSYSYFTHSYTPTIGNAFWHSLLTLAIYLAVVRLIKIAVLFVTIGQKPEWKKEFKKLF